MNTKTTSNLYYQRALGPTEATKLEEGDGEYVYQYADSGIIVHNS